MGFPAAQFLLQCCYFSVSCYSSNVATAAAQQQLTWHQLIVQQIASRTHRWRQRHHVAAARSVHAIVLQLCKAAGAWLALL
jgi:hypothetical protein